MFWERLVGACDASVEGGPAITIPSARKSCQSIAPINIPASRNLRSSAGIIDGILPPRWHRSLQASQWLQLRQWLDLHDIRGGADSRASAYLSFSQWNGYTSLIAGGTWLRAGDLPHRF